jgi:hypothetical protein
MGGYVPRPRVAKVLFSCPFSVLTHFPAHAPFLLQPRRVQIDEFIFNLDKRDKLIKQSVASAEKLAKEKEKEAAKLGHS